MNIAPNRLAASVSMALRTAHPPALRNLRQQRATARENAETARRELREIAAAIPDGVVPSGPTAKRLHEATQRLHDAERRAAAARKELIDRTHQHAPTLTAALAPAIAEATSGAGELLDQIESLLVPLADAARTLSDEQFELPTALQRIGPAVAATRAVRRVLNGGR